MIAASSVPENPWKNTADPRDLSTLTKNTPLLQPRGKIAIGNIRDLTDSGRCG
jgi:hypothetical protein